MYRSKYLIDNIKVLGSKSCFAADTYQTMLDYNIIKNTTNSFKKYFEEKVSIKRIRRQALMQNNDTINTDNFTEEDYEAAGKMFIYLTICPKFLFDWTKLYIELLNNSSPDLIVQTLNRIMVTATLKKDVNIKKITSINFEKITNTFNLKYKFIDKFNNGYVHAEKSKANNNILNILATGFSLSTLSVPKDTLHTISNHPVHFYDEEKKLSPSTFIPFCAFGRNMSSMGHIMKPFELPVCQSFRETILNDQLCYEVDLEKYKNVETIEKDLISGLVFIMDYNEDRHVTQNENKIENQGKHFDKYDGSNDDEKALIYLNTIGCMFAF